MSSGHGCDEGDGLDEQDVLTSSAGYDGCDD